MYTSPNMIIFLHKDEDRTGHRRCVLVDWTGSDEFVAEGVIMSEDPQELVYGIPNCVKVLVETAIKPDACLSRPVGEMCLIEEAVGGFIAWPANYCMLKEMETEQTDSQPKVY